MGNFANFYNSDNGDRIYDAESFSEWLRPFFKTGIFNGQLQVVANSGMTVKVKTGNAFIDGKLKYFESETVLDIQPASSTVDRIDSVVVRRNDTARDFTLMVIKGGTSAPLPVRENGVYDLVLAHVSVPKATAQISAGNITDKRMDTSICGWVVSNVEEVDFTQITEQFNDYFSTFKTENTQAFNEWFQTIKGTLDGDTAGNLLNRINEVLTMPLVTSGSCDDIGELGKNISYRVSGDVANKPSTGSYFITAFSYDSSNNMQIAQGISNHAMWKRICTSGNWGNWEPIHSLANGTVISKARNYGEVASWSDGNPSRIDRLYRFVTISGNGQIAIANSTSQIYGTTNALANVGFLGNYANGAEDDATKAIVSILGISLVKTNDNTIIANDYVMSDANGYAVKSSYGYRVIRVVSSGLLEISVSPNTDAIQRTKADLQSVEADVEGLRTEIQNVGGNFIDETNALASAINVKEYTALEDCYVELASSWGSKFHYLINGIQIMDNQASDYRDYFLKSGQTLTAIAEDGKTVTFKVKHAFGLK